jgi:hypothetical protein
MTKKDILKWYATSILPPDGTEELNKFMLHTAIGFDDLWVMPDGSPVGMIYMDLTRALKAYAKYDFTPDDILKMHPTHEEIVAHTLRVKNAPEGYTFNAWRHPIPKRATQIFLEDISK